MSETNRNPLLSDDRPGDPAAAPTMGAISAPTGAPDMKLQDRIFRERSALAVILVTLFFVVVLALWLTYLRIQYINDQKAFDKALISALAPAVVSEDAAGPGAAPDPTTAALHAEAQAALGEAQRLIARAEDAQNTVDLLLSFLEGAAVLVGIAIGAAAYFGFRNYREVSEEARSDHEKTLQIQNDLNVALANLEGRQKQLDQAMAELGNSRAKVEHAQDIFSMLVLAYQELRLGNWQQAYDPALRVLELDPDNVQALYLAGWLENQYIDGKAHLALDRLRRAVRLAPNWPSARAALAVVLRRRARDAAGDEQQRLYDEAVRHFTSALADAPNLLDLNLESFNGPLAAIYRERKQYDRARDAYRQACKVTPGSSYPAGNLATLLLRDSTINGADRQPAIEMYERTIALAQAELGLARRDYFIQMDIAMSALMLSAVPGKSYTPDGARRLFYEAIETHDPSLEMLKVTRRGLEALDEACPLEWDQVKAQLKDLLEDITKRIADRSPAGGDLHPTRSESQ